MINDYYSKEHITLHYALISILSYTINALVTHLNSKVEMLGSNYSTVDIVGSYLYLLTYYLDDPVQCNCVGNRSLLNFYFSC